MVSGQRKRKKAPVCIKAPATRVRAILGVQEGVAAALESSGDVISKIRSPQIAEVEPACFILSSWYQRAHEEADAVTKEGHTKLQNLLLSEGVLAALLSAWAAPVARKIQGDELARKMASLMALTSITRYVRTARGEDAPEPDLISEDAMYCILSSLEQALLALAGSALADDARDRAEAYAETILAYFGELLLIAPTSLLRAVTTIAGRADQFLFHNRPLIDELWLIVAEQSQTRFSPATRVAAISFCASLVEKGIQMDDMTRVLLLESIKRSAGAAHPTGGLRDLTWWRNFSLEILCVSQLINVVWVTSSSSDSDLGDASFECLRKIFFVTDSGQLGIAEDFLRLYQSIEAPADTDENDGTAASLVETVNECLSTIKLAVHQLTEVLLSMEGHRRLVADHIFFRSLMALARSLPLVLGSPEWRDTSLELHIGRLMKDVSSVICGWTAEGDDAGSIVSCAGIWLPAVALVDLTSTPENLNVENEETLLPWETTFAVAFDVTCACIQAAGMSCGSWTLDSSALISALQSLSGLFTDSPIINKVTPQVRVEFFRCLILFVSGIGQLAAVALPIELKRIVTQIFVALLSQAVKDGPQFGLERFGPAILAEIANGIIDNFSNEAFNQLATDEHLVETALKAAALAKRSLSSVRESCMAQAKKAGEGKKSALFDYYRSSFEDLSHWQ